MALFKKSTRCYGQRKQRQKDNSNSFPRHPPKPEWVKKEVIRLKALFTTECVYRSVGRDSELKLRNALLFLLRCRLFY